MYLLKMVHKSYSSMYFSLLMHSVNSYFIYVYSVYIYYEILSVYSLKMLYITVDDEDNMKRKSHEEQGTVSRRNLVLI